MKETVIRDSNSEKQTNREKEMNKESGTKIMKETETPTKREEVTIKKNTG